MEDPNLQENMLWNFETWYERGLSPCFTCFEGGLRPDAEEITDEQLKNICSLFDYFMSSPCSRLYDDKTNKVYPIEAKSRACPTYEDVLSGLKRYKEKYEKLILYSLELRQGEEGKFYKIRFAVFPESHHFKWGWTINQLSHARLTNLG